MKMNDNKDRYLAYNDAANVIKDIILQGQYEASKGVNRVHLLTNFAIGKYISLNSRKGFWGTGALKSISERLRKLLPGLRGYGETQLKEMRLFYEGWQVIDSNSSVTTDKIAEINSSVVTDELQDFDLQGNVRVLVEIKTSVDFPIEDFFQTPFTHHTILLRKCKDEKERFYYMHRCVEEHLSAQKLENIINNDEYGSSLSHTIPSNFPKQIKNRDYAKKAVMQFKDSYFLDFINAEEIGERDAQDIDERVVEKEIVNNIKKFIMAFGKDFSFIGNQYHLEAYSEEFFPDLLFFNRELNALVVVELKTGKFKSAYLGQLMTYLRILDDKVKNLTKILQ